MEYVVQRKRLYNFIIIRSTIKFEGINVYLNTKDVRGTLGNLFGVGENQNE